MSTKPALKTKAYWNVLGPGLTTGAADDDCSGIATYSQQGAQYGFALNWLALVTFPLMAGVQEMCARIGIVTGRGLAANIKRHFPRWVLVLATLLLLAANIFNIGADLGAMAAAARLLYPGISFIRFTLLFVIITLALQIFISYRVYSKYLKYLSFALFAYIFTAFIPSVHMDWQAAFHGLLVPHMAWTKDQIILVCAILGTTISPYLFFWQSNQEVEDSADQGNTSIKLRQMAANPDRLRGMRADVWSGMFYSNLVMFFIISVCAAVLHKTGITNIASAADAANALRPIAGDNAYLLFAIGIIGIGLLAIPVLAGSVSYALSEMFNWREGLNLNLKKASAFYGVIIFATLIGWGINFTGLNPIKALIYSAVANGLAAPILLLLIVLISSNKKIMGDYSSSGLSKFLGWLCVILMTVAGAAAIYTMVV
ncbi:iron transporter [Candidatus Berkelbacteria bacterium CG10_big_fil_rev_8_21_14_0_10_43_13]|uniref:Iron transporter n=1 Tax=Candidatus Berkelbacteria bacterium CG10_big_fil_rev_8_21_14_0_10_43_13 TaxID=1974514 RepID=A0A2H0W7L2_9BACT|nr:MAG: iron transporter [Candidatus Berkelbacteria bacterium CG10_big_fil_rev_8_21_14_0_10_43_13]